MITLMDIFIVCGILAVLVLAGLAVYAGAKVKRSKIKRVESLFEEGGFTSEEIREAVEKDKKDHDGKA
jgi:Tfp pilus assembly protein PilE